MATGNPKGIIGGQFKADCPYCLTRSVSFTAVAIIKWESFLDDSYDVFAQCGYPPCGRGIIKTVGVVAGGLAHTLITDRNPSRIVPRFPSTDAPLHTPDPAARYFKQGRNSNLSGDWDAAGAMFRKALDVGLKHKFSELSGTLFERIQQAKENGGLTDDLAEWAHEIRMEGNAAVHDEDEYTEGQAKPLEAFTDMVFQYLFTLPAMVKKKKEDSSTKKREEGAGEPAT